MSILTQDNLRQEIEKERIIITPSPKKESINGASIDLTLDNEFRIFKVRSKTIDVKETTDYKRYTKKLVTNNIVIRPQETILAVTREHITLPDNIAGRLEGRTRFARLGVLIHISAGLIHPGVSGKQVLEITNLSPNILTLFAGTKICQLILEYTEGPIPYRGKFRTQSSV